MAQIGEKSPGGDIKFMSNHQLCLGWCLPTRIFLDQVQFKRYIVGEVNPH